MIGVRDEHFIHLPPGQMRVRGAAAYHGNVALILQNRSEPEKCQRQSANVFGENAAGLSNWRGKFQCEISGAASEVHNDVTWANTQGLEDCRGALPLVAFRFHHVQARKRVESRIASIEEKKDGQCANKERKKFDAIVQGSNRSSVSGNWAGHSRETCSLRQRPAPRIAIWKQENAHQELHSIKAH